MQARSSSSNPLLLDTGSSSKATSRCWLVGAMAFVAVVLAMLLLTFTADGKEKTGHGGGWKGKRVKRVILL